MVEGFAVDLGGTKTAAARIAAGRIEERLQTPTDGDASFWSQLDAMAALLDRLGFEAGANLGVAVAGRVDGAGRWQAVNAHTLPGIGEEPLLEQMRARFGSNVVVRNDAAAATLAEALMGAGIGADHFAYLTVSTGIGGGVVLSGRLLNSRNGLAGHVGFVSSPLGEARCGSGRYGTMEVTASGRAIAAFAGTRDAKEAFETRTQKAQVAIDRSAAAIARLCGDLTAIFGLDRVAIGGSVGLAKGYLSRVEMHLEREPPLFRVPLTLATLGQDSALLGALLPEG
ncbi:ROK family protein [Qingshengfaniella alkalisoli]|uniref:ROK family protein n=1 Tax=Qingshengfaniella alkalisoli TaxID=2599296 RepID=A0A5B8IXV7_9RHOB|nr:ROK family protein [Qingshengfaniella alkalisoli]QDY70443.1 ROK family protein [Qingshengfaniella alkalisoli]